MGPGRNTRAILESAVEAFKLPNHKHFVPAILSRCAVKDDDIKAAKDWLKPCDPHSDDLRADISYRLGRALIATAEGKFAKVHELLGAGAKDVPVAEGSHPMATLLRANAWEKDGRPDMGRMLITEFLRKGGPYGEGTLKWVRKIYPHLALCQQSMP